MKQKKLTFVQKCMQKEIWEPWAYVIKLYKKGLSCNDISKHFKDKYNITISRRYISMKVQEYSKTRGYKERRNNYIRKNRIFVKRKDDL